ncbi:LysR family transcriptional regulator [Roseovarius sp. SCSIO 43702]|uniref:LysR family transcriptional regulator n=1 Tax=Roseovarius sp. SCSIO 43702 TaxID=2823043 RepID=UPI001C734D78|nr:LysR family transcriptional regulator [Roseovarius sp. SCSIO 43702]QYX55983.1 LysR family transcriptional regulator [Roseovarius sp. SCSIO 43702]
MNITSLRTFIAIVDTGSLVRASQVLHVTQSTVTARLKTLEDALGQQLVNRQKSGVTLTPAGTKLLRYARIMTGLWRQAQYETALPAGLSSVCTFGCDRELWHGPGRAFFDGVVSGHPDMAVSVQQGSGRDLEDWLASGQVDVILTYDAITRGNQTVHPLPPEELVLYSDRPETPIDSDPRYVFVDHGEEYRRQHAETYHDAGIARISFDSSWWALQFLLERGGSAYLPRALAAPHVERGALHVLEAPVYLRKKNLIVTDTAAENWPWFDALVETLKAPLHA